MRLRVAPILIPAVLGLGCTLAGAWGVALLADLHSFRGQYQTDAAWWRTPRYLADVLPPPAAGRLMPGRVWGYRQVATEFPIPTGTGLQAGWFTVWSVEFGWPMPAVRWEELNFRPMYDDLARERIAGIQRAFDERVGWGAGLVVGPPRAPSQRPLRLPVSPMWAGVAVDTAFYGAAGWCMAFGPGVVRRHLRRRRRACPGCGYDVRGLGGCPECGPGGAVGGAQRPA